MARRLKVSLKPLSRGIRKMTRKLKGGLAGATPEQRRKLNLFIRELQQCDRVLQDTCGRIGARMNLILPGK